MTAPDRFKKFNYKVVKQLATYHIYEFDLSSEIDASAVAANIRTCLEGRVKRTESVNIYENRPGFYVTDTEVYTPATNNMFDDLIRVIEEKVADITNTVNNHAKRGLVDIKPVVETFWGVLYSKGDSADWHVHQNIYCYQAVYYAEVEDDSPIMFKNCEGPTLEIRPKPGTLVVFSNRAEHMVPEIISDKTRLVLASNLVYKKS